jgi:hypothetical protein
MDPVNLAYYGVICCCLSLASARLAPWFVRAAAGLGVGLAAAAALPALRGALGL